MENWNEFIDQLKEKATSFSGSFLIEKELVEEGDDIEFYVDDKIFKSKVEKVTIEEINGMKAYRIKVKGVTNETLY